MFVIRPWLLIMAVNLVAGQNFPSYGNPPSRQVPPNSPGYGRVPNGGPSNHFQPGINVPDQHEQENDLGFPKQSVRILPAGSACRPHPVMGLDPVVFKQLLYENAVKAANPYSDPAVEYWYVKPIGPHLDIYSADIAKGTCTTCIDSGDGVLYNSSYTPEDGDIMVGAGLGSTQYADTWVVWLSPDTIPKSRIYELADICLDQCSGFAYSCELLAFHMDYAIPMCVGEHGYCRFWVFQEANGIIEMHDNPDLVNPGLNFLREGGDTKIWNDKVKTIGAFEKTKNTTIKEQAKLK
jgi:hypothetical protein